MENRFSGLFIGLGLLAVGIFLYVGLSSIKDANRMVSVRGLSEREVDADRVLWPVVYTQTGNDLQVIYGQLEAQNKIVVDFLTAGGVPADDIQINAAAMNDLNAERYSENCKNYRYLATQVVTVSSSNVKQVIALQRRQNELLRHNIALSTDIYQYPTQFLFTKLNDIKPEMIEQATKAARESAEKFAQDSQSDIGAIINASQGQFSIEDRDQYTPQIKRVRVVTAIDYALN